MDAAISRCPHCDFTRTELTQVAKGQCIAFCCGSVARVQPKSGLLDMLD